MGNFSSKDSHGPTGTHLESFHTPPASPQSDSVDFLPAVPQPLPPTSPQPSPVAPASPPPQATSPSGKKPPPSASVPPPEWKPRTPHNSGGTSGARPPPGNPETTTAVRGQASLGRNSAPATSTPRTPVSQGKNAAITPTKSPSSVASPVVRVSSGQKWRERDSGLSQSPLPGVEAEELEKLLDECRATLGIASGQDGPPNTAEILKHLREEVKNLRSTMQTERGEWLQFQADLQVAVSVADRLRAEAEEELTALRTAHRDVERELAAAQQRQKEADMQLVTLRGELKESRQRLATLTQAQGRTEAQEPERPANGSDGTQRGRERPGQRSEQSSGQSEDAKNRYEAKTDSKGVTKRYLRNVTNEDRSGEELRPSEARRTPNTERSRSLSRLPAPSDSLTLQNGTTHTAAVTTAESTNKNSGQIRGRRSLDWQEGRTNTDTGKREESLNKYNSSLTELPPTKSQDGFNLLLRRHGGSKRNSLLRWCQSRTQGYKNIDITNFSSSWADGLAFCAVYHTYLPSHIPYSTLSPDNKRENLSLAFKTGETVGISQSLTVEEMLRAGGPDWQRVLSYVESMYRHFEM